MDSNQINDLRHQMKILREKREDLIQPLDLYSFVLDAYEEFDPDEFNTVIDVPEAAAKGPFPFIDLVDADLDFAAAVPLFKKICKVFVDNVETADDVKNIPDTNDENAVESLVRAFRVFAAAGKAGSIEVDRPVSAQMVFISFLTLRRYMDRILSIARSRLDPEENSYEATCPVCGGKPLFAKLIEEEGFRHLVCGACESSWLYKRLKCTFCGNEDQETIEYLMTDEESPYTAFTCDKCRNFLKFIDTRKHNVFIDTVFETIATAHWDYLAQQNGYTSGTPWLGLDTKN
ncbi:MAG TPA: formate dehydrogenase accessory protein FdhE [bacterium]|nr:formate dehydrogenase accessory protein FdhE [bacterium]